MIAKEILLNFAKKYTSKIHSIELVNVSHNTVYKVNCEKPFILRVTSVLHRSKSEILSELDFILFLHNNNVSVAIPLQTVSGDIIAEYISENDTLFIVAFTLADGLQWYDKNTGIYRNDSYYLDFIGRELGKIHKTSQNYKIRNDMFRRQYFEGQHLREAYDIFKKYDSELGKTYKLFMRDLSVLNKNPKNFGLTHGDFLMSNYNVTANKKIVVYDFDECEYSWFISDIAVFLYYHIIGPDPLGMEHKNNEAIKTILLFMAAYLKENPLPLSELINLNLFFILRDYILLSTIIGRGEENYSWWDEKLIKAALPRVLERKAFIDMDIDLIINLLDG